MFDVSKIEEMLLNDDLYSDNLTIKGSVEEALEHKVQAQIHALGLEGTTYASDIGAGNLSYNEAEVRPFDPFGSNAQIQGTGAPGTANGKITWDFLRGQGFTSPGAAGVIGNLMQESGINPLSHQHGGGPGRGIMQWTVNERWASLLSWANKSNKDPNKLTTQLEYMIIEMKQTKHQGKPVFNYFTTVSNLREATLTFERTMERAGKPMMEKRYQYAADALKNYDPFYGRQQKFTDRY